MYATLALQDKIVKYLEESSFLFALGYIDVDMQLKTSGDTMLHVACKYGKADVVSWLLGHEVSRFVQCLSFWMHTCMLGVY